MSLIVDINPVPWKILDQVRARIINNRARQQRQGIEWETREVRRQAQLQVQPLLSRRSKEEPSFIVDTVTTDVFIGRAYRRLRGSMNSGSPFFYRLAWDEVDIWAKRENEPEWLYWSGWGRGTDAENFLYLSGMGAWTGPYDINGGSLENTYYVFDGIPYFTWMLERRLFTYVYISNFVDPDTGSSVPPLIDIITQHTYRSGPWPNWYNWQFRLYAKTNVPGVDRNGNSVHWSGYFASQAETPFRFWPVQYQNYGQYDYAVNPQGSFANDPYPSKLYDLDMLKALPGYVNTQTYVCHGGSGEFGTLNE